MSELHLDLCRQSRKHLNETIQTLKENLRLLEVFINAGLSNGSQSSIPLQDMHLNGHQDDLRVPPPRSRSPTPTIRHNACCCMCPSRMGRKCCNSGIHYWNRIVSNSSVPSYRRRPISMPRLNKTASLRRENAAIGRAQSLAREHSPNPQQR